MTYHFFLGGQDLEMQEIAALLRVERQQVTDLALDWASARLSVHAADIEALPPEVTPVAVELPDDMPPDWPPRTRLIAIDHHGTRVREVCSLRQVFDLLRLPESRWTRRMALVAANDVGHIPAMRKMGASEEEMAAIRAADRSAQGITPEQERQGRAALQAASIRHGVTVAHLPHARMATVTDPLALSPAFRHLPRDVLVFATDEISFFGAPPLAMALHAGFGGGWTGGNPPESAFWGLAGAHATGMAAQAKALACLAEFAPEKPFSTDT